jgi:hypothetical protein
VLRIDERIGVCPPDSLGITAPIIDRDKYTEYAAGLGQTQFMDMNDICCYVNRSLIGYRKGTEQWGTVFRIARPLAAQAAAFATVPTATPNPFSHSQELTVRYELRQLQGMQIQVLNALGQQVLEANGGHRAGAQQWVVPTAALPAGLYTVRLQPASGVPQALKVVKMD